jgi:hypothetical protein
VGNGIVKIRARIVKSVTKSQVLADFIAEWTEPGLSTDVIIPEAP